MSRVQIDAHVIAKALSMRESNMRWPEIADVIGVNLGDLITAVQKQTGRIINPNALRREPLPVPEAPERRRGRPPKPRPLDALMAPPPAPVKPAQAASTRPPLSSFFKMNPSPANRQGTEIKLCGFTVIENAEPPPEPTRATGTKALGLQVRAGMKVCDLSRGQISYLRKVLLERGLGVEYRPSKEEGKFDLWVMAEPTARQVALSERMVASHAARKRRRSRA